MDPTAPSDDDLELFWAEARKVAGLTRLAAIIGVGATESLTPPAWSFGDNAEMADELLALVLAGRKTATSSARWEWEADDEPLPVSGDLAIVCDGSGEPQALLRTVAVDVVPFDRVTAEHAAAEGEGDGSLESWRRAHEAYFSAALARVDRTFAPDMPVVLERFELLHPRPRRR
jgi:uncharacterized protein YhfF